MKLQLFNYYRSSASYRVRLALHYKKLDFDYHAVHLLKNGGEHLSASYQQLNPVREVPTLVHRTFTLSQSLPIIQYLEETFPGRPLLPQSPQQKALVLQFCENINAGAQPLQNLRVVKYLANELSLSESARNRWVEHWIQLNFSGLEKFLERSAGEYCFGDQITAADCFLIPQVFTSNRFQIDLAPYPLIRRINERLLKNPDLERAHPSQQPDFTP